MPKEKRSLASRLNSYVSEFSECSGPVFTTDGKILYCKLCDSKVGSDRKFNVQQHIDTAKHKAAIKRKQSKNKFDLQKTQQQLLSNTKKSSFNKDLCYALLSANIPLNKLNNPNFKSFLEKYTSKEIPNQTTLRKGYVNEIYEDTLVKIRSFIFGKKIWVSIDETTDSAGRYIANVIVGTLELNGPGHVFLLNCAELDKSNHITIAKLFDNSMHILWPEGVRHDDILLFLSDAAPYMVKAGKSLNIFYTKMIHVTCIVHAFHRVAEQIRGHYSKVDKIIANVKKVFCKSPYRINCFKEKAPLLSLPPQPIITRWGTWLKAAIYYCDNYEIIRDIITSFDEKDSVSVENSQKYLSDPDVASNLVYIKSNLGFLPDVITRLEAKNMPLSDGIEIIENAYLKLSQTTGSVGKLVLRKLDDVLAKNNGYKPLSIISKILNGEITSMDGLPEDLKANELLFFKYAPLTSVDVERSFSTYKTLLADNRHSFQVENIRKYLVVQCNSKGR